MCLYGNFKCSLAPNNAYNVGRLCMIRTRAHKQFGYKDSQGLPSEHLAPGEQDDLITFYITRIHYKIQNFSPVSEISHGVCGITTL